MNTVTVLLALTMVFGALAAVSGALELAGGPAHGTEKPSRAIYLNSLGGATVSALALAAVQPDWMLLLLAALAAYLLFSAARNRRAAVHGHRRAGASDWGGALVLAAVYAGLACFGLAGLPDGAALAPVALALGGVGAFVAERDLESWLLPDIGESEWLRRFRIRATSAQVSVFALVCVVDFSFVASPLRWAFPALGAAALAGALLRRLTATAGTQRRAH